MKLFNVNKKVINYYRTCVKDNQDASVELIRKKLTRNIHLATKYASPLNDDRDMYMYGNLRIWVRGNKIYHIHNVKHNGAWFYKDINKYNELNELLGINELESQEQITA